jgi:hypothetical protein
MAMSSIMRSRSALTGRCEGWEVIGGSSLELKVAGPSMLGIGCPDRHAFLFTPSMPPPKTHRPRRALSRESGFVLRRDVAGVAHDQNRLLSAGIGNPADHVRISKVRPERP